MTDTELLPWQWPEEVWRGKVERVRAPSQNKRVTELWFAKDWDYLLVQLRQVETDGKEYVIVLQEGTVDGKTVKGN